jgi:hypothetical protein
VAFCCSPASAQSAYDRRDVVLLEQTDGGDARCTGAQARFRVLQSYSSERQHGDSGAASLGEGFGALWDGSGGTFFFEDWSEDRKGSSVCSGLRYFFRRMTGDCYDRISG